MESPHHLIHPAVVRLVGNLFSEELEGETEAEFVGTRETGQQAVVVALATSQAVAQLVEGHAGNDGQGDAVEVSEQFARRFQNAVAAKGETIGTGVAVQFKVVAHHGGENDFLLTTPTADESMSVHLVGQGMIEQYGASLSKPRMLLQTLEHRYRKGFQLRTGVGSLYGTDGLAEDALGP